MMLVFRDKRVKGSRELPVLPGGACVGLEGIATRYHTDAHFMPVAGLEGTACRPNKGLEEHIPSILVTMKVVDVDSGKKGEDISEWLEGEHIKIDAIPETPGYYQTNNGYRLLWVEPTPLTPAAHEESYPAFLDWLEKTYGIVGDPTCRNWTRLFRLPFVVRDGEVVDLPALLENIPTTPAEAPTASAPSGVFAGIEDTRIPLRELSNFGKVINGNRNNTLARIAGKLAVGGTPLEVVVSEASRYNARWFVPALTDVEVEECCSSIVRREAERSGVPTTVASSDPMTVFVQEFFANVAY
jgi:hypothetical protein